MNSTEVMNKIYDLMGVKKVSKTEAEWESFDTECFEVISNEAIEVVKEKATKLENLNIFTNNFSVLGNMPKTWGYIYSVLNEYYAINPRIVEYNETISR